MQKWILQAKLAISTFFPLIPKGSKEWDFYAFKLLTSLW